MNKKFDNYIPPTFIQDLAIELKETFDFDNLPHTKDTATTEDKVSVSGSINGSIKPYIGRETSLEKFKRMLASKKGVYLVTGYRGMGKTSFVNKAVANYNKEAEEEGRIDDKLDEIRIVVSPKQPGELEMLQLIVAGLRQRLKEIREVDKKYLSKTKVKTGFNICAVLAVLLFILFLYEKNKIGPALGLDNIGFMWDVKYSVYSLQILMYLLFFFTIIFGISALITKFKNRNVVYESIDDLYKRCYAQTSVEDERKTEMSFDAISTKIAQAGGKKTENYMVASAKEIESSLEQILKICRDKHKLNFVFIFDELDKVESLQSFKNENNDGTSETRINPEKALLEQLRERRWAVQNIIAGLKNFITTVNAPFIFIAGREMYDASMADIADRQSSISSIFSYVFYIESLLLDAGFGKVENKESEEILVGQVSKSLSAGIERYLFELIVGKPMTANDSLYEIRNKNAEDRKNAVKVNLFLQNFVVYLTYRSNGSPKKLIRLIHEFVKVVKDESELKNVIVWRDKSDEENKTTNEKESDLKKPRCYLYFSYKQQQRIGFISYVYRPFLIKFGSSFKKSSDNLVVATSFLFDHLLKFHPFAFSNAHLELIPEVLSTSRTPALKDHIRKIVDYLSLNHIKETEIGLFDFKFYSKTVNEIYYLSKTFEEESAAFNFTLDESYLIKLHVREKLKEIRKVYTNFLDTSENANQLIFSIAYLNGVLGDLHYFDQDFDEAIIAYSDAFKPINTMQMDKMNLRDFVILLKYKLKLGLTFEKIKAFEESLALYADAVQDAKRFITARLNGENFDKYAGSENNFFFHKEVPKNENTFFISSALSDILQIANQAFLAKMILQEKMGVEGITAAKSAINLGGFLNMAEGISQKCGTNSTIITNLYFQLGNLLYYKNSNKAFEWEHFSKNAPALFPPKYYQDIIEIKKRHNRFDTDGERYRTPIMALNIYCLGIKYLLEGRVAGISEFNFDAGKPIITILDAVKPAKLRIHRTSLTKIHYKNLANSLSSIGDCLLSMFKNRDVKQYDIGKIIDGKKLSVLADSLRMQEVLEAIELNQFNLTSEIQNWLKKWDYKDKIDDVELIKAFLKTKSIDKQDSFQTLLDLAIDQKEDLSLHTVICYYYLSAYYYKTCSRFRSYSFQLRKILYLVRLVVTEHGKNGKVENDFLHLLDRKVVKEILKTASGNVEFTDIHEQLKFEEYLNKNADTTEKSTNSKKIKNNIFNFPDTREVIILYEHIKLKFGAAKYTEITNLIDSANSISTQYLRLLELTYVAKAIEVKWEKEIPKIKMRKEKLDSLLQNYTTQMQQDKLKLISTEFTKEASPFVLTEDDAICYLHSLMSIIQTVEVYDNDYFIGNSFIAYHHYRLAKFLTVRKDTGKNEFGFVEKQLEKAKNRVVDLIAGGKGAYGIFDPAYNYQKADSYYQKAIMLHSAGDEYKKAINETLYLEDDLNDAAYHFGAAMDRYQMINNVFFDMQQKCRKALGSNYYSRDNYLYG